MPQFPAGWRGGEGLIYLLPDDRPDALRSQFGHAFEPVALPDKAGSTPHATLHGDGVRSVRTGELGVSTRIDTNYPRSRRRGQMKRAGVVGNDQVGFESERCELDQPGSS